MGKTVRINLLASAVGIAMLGLGMATTVPAQTLTVETSAGIRESSIGQYIITFGEPGLLHYTGSVSGLAATAPEATGSRKLEANSIASQSYLAHLEGRRLDYIAQIEHALGRSINVTHHYRINENGIAAQINATEAAAIAALPIVASVRPVEVFELHTFQGPAFIGANTIWDGTGVPASAVGTKGEGIKVGIIDAGAHIGHPSFDNRAACGHSIVNPKLVAVDCMTTNMSGQCVGADPNGIDSGHGVHTGSTAAGNEVDSTFFPAPLLPVGLTMSGVAPCATVYSYKVCEGGCTGSAINAAIEAIAVDQVDVANYSIGPTCGGGSPWADSQGFLNAFTADVFVAASAGNTRTDCPVPTGRVANLGPWVTTVAASTQDKLVAPSLSVTGPGTPPPALVSIPLNPGSTTNVGSTVTLDSFPIRTYPANLAGCTTAGGFPAGYFSGSVAVVRRGFNPPSIEACTFTEKINNAAAAGAVYVVIANNQTAACSMDTSGSASVPSFCIESLTTADALIAFVGANLGPIPAADTIFKHGFDYPTSAAVDYERFGIVDRQGDVLAGFSFRGPTSGAAVDLTKPDITAPGVDIYAAGRAADGNYYLESGTSMSSPHIAGAAALVRKVQPTWSVAEVKSAIMTTASNAGTREDGVTPWNADDVGSGRVDLSKATRAGLTLNETTANFNLANPSGGTLPVKDLNLPSLRNSNCVSPCTWTRTVRNRLSTSGTWNVSVLNPAGHTLAVVPSSFTLAPGATQTFTVTATTSVPSTTAFVFGQVILTETGALSPVQHLSVAIKDSAVVGPGAVDLVIDTFTSGNFNLLGSAAASPPLQFLWLNRFTPDSASYPFTLTSLETIFASTVTGGTVATVLGEQFDFYVFQDNDTNPANGATLVGSVLNVPVSVQNAVQTIPVPGGITLNGPGDVLIAVFNRGRQGQYPASADMGPGVSRSWISAINPSMPGDPNLATLTMVPVTTTLPSFQYNWILRGRGTTTSGAPVNLE